MKPESSVYTRLQILEFTLKNDESIQHTYKYPQIQGEIEALKWVLEDLKL